jgi:hypothetical protein
VSISKIVAKHSGRGEGLPLVPLSKLRKAFVNGRVKGEIWEAGDTGTSSKHVAFPLIRLDRFPGVHGTGNGYLSAGFANECAVDEYIIAFTKYMYPLIEALDGDMKLAFNIVLSTRNGSKKRSRMAAVKEVAKLAPIYKLIKDGMNKHDFAIRIDAYDFHDIWLYRGKNKKGEYLLYDGMNNIRIEGSKIVVGSGDGYHRAHNEEWFVELADPNCIDTLAKNILARVYTDEND